jgi:hypothetical protein
MCRWVTVKGGGFVCFNLMWLSNATKPYCIETSCQLSLGVLLWGFGCCGLKAKRGKKVDSWEWMWRNCLTRFREANRKCETSAMAWRNLTEGDQVWRPLPHPQIPWDPFLSAHNIAQSPSPGELIMRNTLNSAQIPTWNNLVILVFVKSLRSTA